MAKREASRHKQVGKLATWYKGILNWTLNHKVITSLISIILLAGSCSVNAINWI